MLFEKEVFLKFTSSLSLKNSLIVNGKKPEATYLLPIPVTMYTLNLSFLGISY